MQQMTQTLYHGYSDKSHNAQPGHLHMCFSYCPYEKENDQVNLMQIQIHDLYCAPWTHHHLSFQMLRKVSVSASEASLTLISALLYQHCTRMHK
jgi:hypothetical protein